MAIISFTNYKRGQTTGCMSAVMRYTMQEMCIRDRVEAGDVEELVDEVLQPLRLLQGDAGVPGPDPIGRAHV